MSADKVYRTELTPVDFLRRSARVFPGRTAVVHGERRFTYAELEARVNRLASALRGAGLEKGQRAAFLSPNTPALLEAHFAVPAAGGVLVAVNTRLNSGEIGAPCGVTFRSRRARFVRRVPPSPSSSSTGISSHALIHPSMRPSLTRRAMLRINSACGISPK